MSGGRDTHTDKYDRQMRLWGGHGQQALEEACVCVLGSGPTASETLKNLVLPNVGRFTVVDDALVQASDLGNNFFVEESSLGKPRAQVVREFLLEMNPDLKDNSSVIKNPAELIDTDLTFFDKFDLVIMCGQPQAAVLKLAEYMQNKQKPLLVLHAYGLFGYARLQTAEHCVTESHFTNDRYDLFIHPDQLNHFPELKAFVDGFDIAAMRDGHEFAHIPYIVIVAQELNKWQQAHDGKVPSTYDEKTAFKAQIKATAVVFSERDDNANEAGVVPENWMQAHDCASKGYIKTELDARTKQVVADPKGQEANLQKDSADFWIMVAATNKFMSEDSQGLLPCSNAIPDMISEPHNYIKLKKIYEARALADTAKITAHVGTLLTKLGRAPTTISAAQIDYFVKNLRGLRVIRTRSLAEEHTSFNSELEEGFWDMEYSGLDEENPEELIPPKNVNIYFALRMAFEFQRKHGRYPGVNGEPFKDAETLVEMQQEFYKKAGLNQPVVEECLHEISRFGATELHNIAAFMGGVGAQVALKVIMKQYVPLDNTLVFNGVHGGAKVFQC